MENILVGAIVGLAVFFFVRGVHRSFKAKDTPTGSCGCSTCPSAAACNQLPQSKTQGPDFMQRPGTCECNR